MKKANDKKIIIGVIIILLIILMIILFTNSYNKKTKDKTFNEKLDTVKQIDIIITAPYDTNATMKSSKTITSKDEIKEIIAFFKDISITDNIANNISQDDKFHYTLLLENENNQDNLNIYFNDDSISVNGFIANMDEANIDNMNEYVENNIKGYGTLTCQSETIDNTVVEKYYFQDSKIYHYSKSQTYIPDDITQIDNSIAKYNTYKGVTAMGNKLGEKKYSYLIDIDLTQISDNNYKTITSQSKEELMNKTKEQITKETTKMNCDFIFLK